MFIVPHSCLLPQSLLAGSSPHDDACNGNGGAVMVGGAAPASSKKKVSSDLGVMN